MSFPRRYRRNLGRPAPTTSTETNSAPSTTIYSPSPSSSGLTGVVLTGGASPLLIAGFITLGAFAVAIISIWAWRKNLRRGRGRGRGGTTASEEEEDSVILRQFGIWRGRGGRGRFGEEGTGAGAGGQDVHRRGRRRWREGRERGRSNAELSKAKPEMFHVWISKGRIVDTLKWEAESLPLSATLITVPVIDVSSRAGRDRDSVEEEEEEEKRCPGSLPMQMREAVGSSSTMQVAVLLRMPSPPSHAVHNDISVRGELAIGLVEASWTREHPSSRGGEGTTTS